MTFDFEKTLREQAEKCQDENRARFLAGETLDGGSVVPVKDAKTEQVGVRTGALLADITRRENIRADNPPHIVLDTHFQLEGPIVEQLTDAFADDWLFTTGEKLLTDNWFPPLEKAGTVTARVVTSIWSAIRSNL